MSIERVKKCFAALGIEDRILEFPVSSATVQMAAAAIGCGEEQIAKTLSFNVDGACILIVMAGDARVDNPKFKAQFKTKAKMLSAEDTAVMTGHAVGGVCPFALPEDVKVYLDKSLLRFESVFPACGSSNSAIELTVEELSRFSGAEGIIDVCKDWRQE